MIARWNSPVSLHLLLAAQNFERDGLNSTQRITKDYPEVDGFLGFALFTEYLLTLDYPAMQVRLARGALPKANGADILPFEIENRIPVIEVAVGKLRMKAHVDSGNFVAGFILPEDVVEQLTLLSEPVTVGRARSVTNKIEIGQPNSRTRFYWQLSVP